MTEQLYTRRQAAAYLGISVVTLDRLCTANGITFIQRCAGAKKFFSKSALDSYITKCTHRAYV